MKSQTNYVVYNSPQQVKELDRNNVYDKSRIVTFPGRIYAGEAFPDSQYICQSGPRSTNTNYLMYLERYQHPDTFSRFSYGDCPFGYCNGNYSRGYSVPPSCFREEEPIDMAPPKYYEEKYLDPFSVRTDAYWHQNSTIFTNTSLI